MKNVITPATLVLVLALLTTQAAATLTQSVDRINFDSSKNHNITLTWTGSGTATIIATYPSAMTFVSAESSCSSTNSTATTCTNVASGVPVWYVLSSPESAAEYSTYTLSAATNTSESASDIKLVNIDEHEVFYTLVEYGRGRGNYFYATASKAKGMNLTQSYIPEDTDMELNFLHKVINIGRYIGLPSETATQANWSCEYPDKTVIRQHNIQAMSDSGNSWDVAYNIEEVETSWERMGYLSMQIDSGEYSAGNEIPINCTDIEYSIGNGKVVIDSDNFTLNVVSREPISVTAYPAVSSVSNGTSEVEITYEVQNSQAYDISDVVVQIQAPEAATFVGTRGELWGASEDVHFVEFVQLAAGDIYNITLVARFDTSLATDTSLSASKGIQAKFVAPWEKYAYNPIAYIQDVSVSETITWNQGAETEVTNIISTINSIDSTVTTINNLVSEINATTHSIDSTVTTIETFVTDINTTTHNISDTLQQSVIPSLTTIQSYTDQVETLVLDTIDLMDCSNATADSVCDRLLVLNSTVNSVQSDTAQIISDISTLNSNMNSNFTLVLSRFDEVDANLTEIDSSLSTITSTVNTINSNTLDIIDLLDCDNSTSNSVCDKLDDITAIVADANSTVYDAYSVVSYINVTRWGTLTANDLYTAVNSAISQLNANTTEILKRIRLHKEFSEELVFLITDSVNSQVMASNAIKSKDLQTAVVHLESAQKSLNEVNTLLLQQKATAESQIDLLPYLLAVGIIAGCVLASILVKKKYSTSNVDAVPRYIY